MERSSSSTYNLAASGRCGTRWKLFSIGVFACALVLAPPSPKPRESQSGHTHNGWCARVRPIRDYLTGGAEDKNLFATATEYFAGAFRDDGV